MCWLGSWGIARIIQKTKNCYLSQDRWTTVKKVLTSVVMYVKQFSRLSSLLLFLSAGLRRIANLIAFAPNGRQLFHQAHLKGDIR